MKTFLTLILFILTFALPAWATTRYVDGNLVADCTGNYSIANRNCTGADGDAWNTIAEGIANTAAADTLLIRAGTYVAVIPTTITSGTSDAQRTIIQAYNAETVTLQPTGAVAPLEFANKSNITFDGLIFDGVNANYDTVIMVQEVTNITIQNSVIKNAHNAGSACFTQSGPSSAKSTNVRLINNEIGPCSATTGGAPAYSHGVYIFNLQNSFVERNYIHGMSSHGIHAYTGDANTNSGNVIRYNYIYNNGTQCARLDQSVNIEFYGNICHANGVNVLGGWGVVNDGGGSGGKVFNNTIYDHKDTGACILINSGTSWTVRNNLCLSNVNNTITNLSTGGATSNNVTSTTNTILIDVATAKFSPSASGVATLVDQGSATGLPSGFTAAGSSAPDVGAFEAPIRSSAVVEDADRANYRISFSLPTQSVTPGTGIGLQNCTGTDFALRDDGAGKIEGTCTIVGTNRADVAVTDGDFTAGVIDDAYTLGTLTDNVRIGGSTGHTAKNAQVLSWTAQTGTNHVTAPSAQDWAVIHWRQRSWYGAIGGADWVRAEDADGIVVPGGKIAVDVAIACTGANCDSTSFEWWADEAAGADFAITDSLATNKIAFSNDAPSVSDLQAITAATLTNPHATFVNGAVIGQQASQPTVDLSQDSMTQVRLLLKVSPTATATTQFRIFVRRAGAGSNITMTVTPSFSIIPMMASSGF